MEDQRCVGCGGSFRPSPRVSKQSYCPEDDCQRQRRRLWQQAKRRQDPDYRANQVAANRAWSDRNPDYWRVYRDSHPEYCSKNRARQTRRNSKRGDSVIAKMDAITLDPSLPSGIYRVTPIAGLIAKMDSILVEITLLSGANQSASDCKERTR